jgi:hypothetical protein
MRNKQIWQDWRDVVDTGRVGYCFVPLPVLRAVRFTEGARSADGCRPMVVVIRLSNVRLLSRYEVQQAPETRRLTVRIS